MLDAEEDAAHQDVECEIPVLDRGFGDRAKRAAEPGVVEDHVEAPEAIGRRLHHALDILFRRYVHPQAFGAVGQARAAELVHQLFVVGLVEVADDDPGALFEEAEDGGATHAAGPSGYDRHLSVQTSRHRDDPPAPILHDLPPERPWAGRRAGLASRVRGHATATPAR